MEPYAKQSGERQGGVGGVDAERPLACSTCGQPCWTRFLPIGARVGGDQLRVCVCVCVLHNSGLLRMAHYTVSEAGAHTPNL